MFFFVYSSFNNNLSTVPRVSDMDDMLFFDDEELAPQQATFSSNIPTLPSEGSPEKLTVIHDDATQSLKMFTQKLNSFDTDSIDSGFVSNSSLRRKSTSLFHSNSMDSMDDEYMELMALEDDLPSQKMPNNLSSLITSSIKTNAISSAITPEMKRPTVRRCLSLNENNSMMKARSLLFEPKTPEILRTVQENGSSTTPRSGCFKRPDPPSTTASPINSKRYKTTVASNDKENAIAFRPTLRKCISMNDADIMSALSRPENATDLIGDHSKPFALPLIKGRHHDLKSITCDTMASLMRGEFDHKVASFKVIDCRYPYEFEGGHIRGAMNLYNQDLVMEKLVNNKTEEAVVLDAANEPKRHILVFHCEFSSERGPKMSRFLRNYDRNANQYPELIYPEVYLLHNGYKEFYESYSELCDPIAYRPMLDPSFNDDLRHFRSKSKSWNGEAKAFGGTQRLKKSRSRLVL